MSVDTGQVRRFRGRREMSLPPLEPAPHFRVSRVGGASMTNENAMGRLLRVIIIVAIGGGILLPLAMLL